MRSGLESLLAAARSCRACEAHLPLGPRPVLRAGARARILIVGQAPGARVHATGIPWDDPSGERLRAWMGVDDEVFYDESRIAIISMGFCELTLLIGQYAQRHFLGPRRRQSLAATVGAWQDYAPRYLPLPHPSPRNQPWFKQHPWFELALLPVLRGRVAESVK